MSKSLYKVRTVTKTQYDSEMGKQIGYRWATNVKGLAFGLELEMENAMNLDIPTGFMDKWINHADGSLRNNGIEFVTRTPMVVEKTKEALDLLEQFINSNRQLDFSERTSFHVHMNVQSSTTRQLHNFLTLYYTLENLLVLRSGHDRRVGNHFCLRISDANRVKTSVLDSFSGYSMGQMFTTERYLALNLQAFGKFGTLEFRAHRGTRDVSEYRKLVNSLAEMYNHAHNVMKEPNEIFYGMSSYGFLEYFKKMLPVTMRYLFESDSISEQVALNSINEAMIFSQGLAACVTIQEEKVKPKVSFEATYGEQEIYRGIDIDRIVDRASDTITVGRTERAFFSSRPLASATPSPASWTVIDD